MDEILEEKIKELSSLINSANKIVFFGGAGVSTESGIPDFRSANGLYSLGSKELSVERILSHNYFKLHPKDFYEFYREKMIYKDAEPSETHIKLAELEKAGKDITLITQNIDGLHQRAGSKNVIELHGSIYRNYCCKCGQSHTLEEIIEAKEKNVESSLFKGVPICSCGGIIKPDVVLYGENLDTDLLRLAAELIYEADLLIIAGTSLNVNPAASLVKLYQGKDLVLINKSPTAMDLDATLLIKTNLGQVFSHI